MCHLYVIRVRLVVVVRDVDVGRTQSPNILSYTYIIYEFWREVKFFLWLVGLKN